MTIEEIYEKVKQETNIEMFKIEKEKSDNLTIFDSKYGGYPYWDLSKEFPLDSENEKMCLLAQINFDKENFNDKRLPKRGILQFFISVSDDVYGMSFKNQDKQYNWRVVYHKDINYNITEEDIKNIGIKTFKDVSPKYYAPFNDCYRIKFNSYEECITYNDKNFTSVIAKILNRDFNIEIRNNYSEVREYLISIDKNFYKKFEGWGDKLLGYPAFTQSDPRDIKYEKYDTLLLQIDSEDEIMWGDCGVANFFINREDLLNGDFSNILYNWDCC